MTDKLTPFQAHLEEIAKQPDPPAAFRGDLVKTLMENHPGLTAERAEQILDEFGA